MPMHPQVLEIMAKRKASVPPISGADPMEARRKSFLDTWREAGPEMHSVEDLVAESADGAVPIRLYRPNDDPGLPVLMSYHGGGFIYGSIESYDGNARRLAAGAGCAVVTVEYRLAPENTFPCAPNDSYSALVWVHEHAAELGLDPTRIAVGGDSAGANLSTVVAMMSRDQNGPALSLQILMCPAVHPDFKPAIHDPEITPPMEKSQWWNQYLRDADDATNPYAVPMAATDLTGLPPALVVTAEYDELLGEGEAYAQRLSDAGVATTYRRYDGMWHIFHMYPAYIDAAREAVDEEIAALRAAFSV